MSVPRWRRALSWIFLLAGVGLLVGLVVESGPARVLEAILLAGPFLPAIMLFDAGWFLGEVLAHRACLGERAREVPASVYVRANLSAFAFVVLAPIGKAGAELARAAAFAERVGGPRAAAAAANAQIASLLANMLVSVPCALAIFGALGPDAPLGWFVVGNAAVTGSIGVFTLVLARRGRLGERVAKRFEKLGLDGEGLDVALRLPRPALARAVGWAFLGRCSQTAQYGLVLVAVGGVLTLASAFATQGAHLVGAGLGDFVPGQVGVVEGSYRVFADALGFGGEPARALTIGLIARVSSYVLAATCLAALALWRRPERSEG